jgi:hypothetical protein
MDICVCGGGGGVSGQTVYLIFLGKYPYGSIFLRNEFRLKTHLDDGDFDEFHGLVLQRFYKIFLKLLTKSVDKETCANITLRTIT